MPLDTIDNNNDKIIVQQELQKALDAWFFDSPDHIAKIGKYLTKINWNQQDKLLSSMKQEMVKCYFPAKARMEADLDLKSKW